MKIKNDNQENEEFYQFLLASFTNIKNSMANDASIYVFMLNRRLELQEKAFEDAGFLFVRLLHMEETIISFREISIQWQH